MNSHPPACPQLGRPRRRHAPLASACIAVALAACSSGCALWPWKDNDKCSIITPAMRAASIREMGPRAEDASDAEQLAMCEELAQQIRTEPDPIVRRAIQETIAEFQAPLASTVLIAGLNDQDRDVRTTCCRKLGERQDGTAVATLGRIVASESDPEVRMAAIEALGRIKSPASVQALAAAVKDRDPAMQYAGVLAMQEASGEELGNDVEAWRQYADSLGPAAPAGQASEINVAAQPGAQSPLR
jgi:HEAT repeat protein